MQIILLQAAMGAGVIGLTLIIFGVLLVTPLTVGILMKLIWRIRGKNEYIDKKMPYYKDPFWFIGCLVVSTLTVGFLFTQLLLYLGRSLEF